MIVTSQPIRILQITDLHLFGDRKTTLININPYQSLQQVITLIQKNITKKQPSLLVLTGDISQDYSQISYETAKSFFHDFPCPIAITMGNHEYPPLFITTFGDPAQIINKAFIINNWYILLLNSHWPGHVSGQLADTELDYLRQTLDSLDDHQHVIIFLHHHILPVGSYWIDNIRASNAAQFLEIIDQYHNIKAVICGHVHQETSFIRRGVNYLSTPSTVLQFAVNSQSFKLDSLMPGYRWIDLYEDGSFETGVVRVDYDKAMIPDLDSRGY